MGSRKPVHPDVLCVDGNRVCVAVSASRSRFAPSGSVILLGTTAPSVTMSLSDAMRLRDLLSEAIAGVLP